MFKTPMYRYMGTNGIIESPIHLEGIYTIRLMKLDAGNGKVLTDGDTVVRSVTVPLDEVDRWSEIEMGTKN